MGNLMLQAAVLVFMRSYHAETWPPLPAAAKALKLDDGRAKTGMLAILLPIPAVITGIVYHQGGFYRKLSGKEKKSER